MIRYPQRFHASVTPDMVMPHYAPDWAPLERERPRGLVPDSFEALDSALAPVEVIR